MKAVAKATIGIIIGIIIIGILKLAFVFGIGCLGTWLLTKVIPNFEFSFIWPALLVLVYIILNSLKPSKGKGSS